MALVLASSSAFAINTYRSTQYPCAELKTIVQSQGAVKLVYPPFGASSVVYSDPNQCAGSSGTSSWEPSPLYVAASDTWFCQVGYICEEENNAHH